MSLVGSALSYGKDAVGKTKAGAKTGTALGLAGISVAAVANGGRKIGWGEVATTLEAGARGVQEFNQKTTDIDYDDDNLVEINYDDQTLDNLKYSAKWALPGVAGIAGSGYLVESAKKDW